MNHASFGRRLVVLLMGLMGMAFVCLSAAAAMLALKCGLTSDRFARTKPRVWEETPQYRYFWELKKRPGQVLGLEAPVKAEPLRPPLLRKSAVYLFCTWCDRDTVHLRHGQLFKCCNESDHASTFAYRSLAASFPDADRYPGCICVDGELSVYGRPDYRCFGLNHRP